VHSTVVIFWHAHFERVKQGVHYDNTSKVRYCTSLPFPGLKVPGLILQRDLIANHVKKKGSIDPPGS